MCMKLKQNKLLLYKCGKCFECRKNKYNQWFTRLYGEFEYSNYAYFVTYTYQDIDEVKYSDVQKFYKRLRSYGYKIKHFTVYEEGEKSGRPHYHAILYSNKPISQSFLLYCWGKGFIYYGSLKVGGIAYTLKYILKSSDVNYRFSQALGQKFRESLYKSTKLISNLVDVCINGKYQKLSIPPYWRKCQYKSLKGVIYELPSFQTISEFIKTRDPNIFLYKCGYSMFLEYPIKIYQKELARWLKYKFSYTIPYNNRTKKTVYKDTGKPNFKKIPGTMRKTKPLQFGVSFSETDFYNLRNKLEPYLLKRLH